MALTHLLFLHLKGVSIGHIESPAQSASPFPQNPFGQWNGLLIEQPL